MTCRLIPKPDWFQQDDIQQLLNLFAKAGVELRFVGGVVRDHMLNRDIADFDLATPLPPEDVITLLSNANIRHIPTGLKHGTITALINKHPFEITTLRRDVETDGRHAVVEFCDNWQEDAKRRDFTINAMSLDMDGYLYDYFNGLDDLKAGCIRFVGKASDRINEDALRLMRFFRFYAHYGNGPANQEALNAAKAQASNLQNLSGERVHSEILKLLSAPNPVPALKLMCDLQVLGYCLGKNHDFNPDLSAISILINIEKMLNHPADPLLKLGLVLFGGTDLTRTNVTAMSKYLHFSNKEKKRLLYLTTYDDFFACIQHEAGLRSTLYHQGQKQVADLLFICHSINLIDLSSFTRLWQQMENWIKPHFPLDGRDVHAHGTIHGPDIGKLLAEVENWWIEHNFTPDRPQCLTKLKRIY
jgi:poly(A) polymerase